MGVTKDSTGRWLGTAECRRGHPHTERHGRRDRHGHWICRTCKNELRRKSPVQPAAPAEDTPAAQAARMPDVPDAGCPDWGIPSCLTCPLLTCREDDFRKAEAQALRWGLIRPSKARTKTRSRIDAARKAARLAYDAGYTAADVHRAGVLGVAWSTLHEWWRAWDRGEEPGSGGTPPSVHRETVLSLLRQGYRQKEAAAAVGVRADMVNRWVRRWRAEGMLPKVA